MKYVRQGRCVSRECDKLSVEADVLTILGVLFCVMHNALNLFEIKEQEHRGTVNKVLHYPISPFLYLMEMLVPFPSHNCFPRRKGSIFIFDTFWINNVFKKI